MNELEERISSVLSDPAQLEKLANASATTYLDAHTPPFLILHGTADEVVPCEDSRRFADDNLIEFIPVEKADHRFQNPNHMSLATKNVMRFFGFA